MSKKNQWFLKNKKDFDAGKIKKENITKLPPEESRNYLILQLNKKYGRNVTFTCTSCAITALYEDNGYVTDEEIIRETGLRHK